MKKRILSVALVVAMLAIVITGGTLAYLQDTDGDKNVMTAGNVYITQNEVFDENSAHLIPAIVNGSDIQNKVTKTVDVTNTGTEAAYVRTIFLSEASGDDLVEKVTEQGVELKKHDVEVEYDGVEYVVYSYTYENAVAAGYTSGDSLVEIYLKSGATNEWYTAVGGSYDLFVFSQAVQSAGWSADAVNNKTAAQVALDTAFGEIDDEVQNWVTVSNVLSAIKTPNN